MKWISVNDEWPEDGEPVLIFSEGVGVEPACQRGGKAFYLLIAPDEQEIRALPSHWMPYPEPPLEVEILCVPRSQWPKRVLKQFRKANGGA